MRIFLVVIDSFGIGAMPDAACFGDEGSDTYGNIFCQTGVVLHELVSLGLNNIAGVAKNFPNGRCLAPVLAPRAAFARLREKTFAKDTTAGHYEIAGLVLDHPFPVFPHGFPPEIVRAVEQAARVRFIGNEVASGTEIICRLGEEHGRTGMPILYTSQDSVMQIAANTAVVPLEKLYAICQTARKVMQGEWSVGRVIARPFVYREGKFVRTEDRKDYALEPPGMTILDRLADHGIPVTAIGKIRDIFCGRGIAKSVHTGNNHEGLAALQEAARIVPEGLIFVNLVDTDMLYGHRNDVVGYAKALKEIDEFLPQLERGVRDDDIILITADHGCDPTTVSTDHSREYVPLLIFGKGIKPLDLATLDGFDHIAQLIAAIYGIGDDSSIYQKVMREDWRKSYD